jgi:hypothetical protein
MKILFAPYNIASMPAITAKALAELGHQAKCINYGNHPYKEGNEFVIEITNGSGYSNLFTMIIYKIKYILVLYRLLKWCDVVHWTWRSIFPFSLDLKLVKWFNKPRFVEWVGSDIRIPEITKIESEWYWEAYNNQYEYKKLESRIKSVKTQRTFAKHGFVPVLTPEMKLFLIPELFKKSYTVNYRIFENNKYFIPIYPDINNQKPLILHTPTARIAKGSNYIIPLLEDLNKKYDFDFILLDKVSRQTVLNKMQHCDIFIDQIILGSYASAAIEAMAFGKPVIAYIMPRVFQNGISEECPIINANPGNLREKLIELIENPILRHETGIKSRNYVEKYHEVNKLTRELLEIYSSNFKD